MKIYGFPKDYLEYVKKLEFEKQPNSNYLFVGIFINVCECRYIWMEILMEIDIIILIGIWVRISWKRLLKRRESAMDILLFLKEEVYNGGNSEFEIKIEINSINNDNEHNLLIIIIKIIINTIEIVLKKKMIIKTKKQ